MFEVDYRLGIHIYHGEIVRPVRRCCWLNRLADPISQRRAKEVERIEEKLARTLLSYWPGFPTSVIDNFSRSLADCRRIARVRDRNSLASPSVNGGLDVIENVSSPIGRILITWHPHTHTGLGQNCLEQNSEKIQEVREKRAEKDRGEEGGWKNEERKARMLYVHLHFGTFIATSSELFSNFSHLPSSDLICHLLSSPTVSLSLFLFLSFFFCKNSFCRGMWMIFTKKLWE